MSIITDNLPKVAHIGTCGVCRNKAEVFSINGKITCESCFDKGSNSNGNGAHKEEPKAERSPVELTVDVADLRRVPSLTPSLAAPHVDLERQELIAYIDHNANPVRRKKIVRQLTAKLQHDLVPVLANERWFSLLDLMCHARELGYKQKGSNDDFGLLKDATP